MRVGIACDHVGFGVKTAVIEALEHDNHAVLDLGTHGAAPTEYAPMARAVAAAVLKNFVDGGIVVCASGIGAAVVANRIPGIRAAAAGDPAAARDSREQIDANVLTIAAGSVGPDAVLAIVKAWTSAEFSRTEHGAAALKLIEDTRGTPISGRAAAAVTAPPVTAPPAPEPVTAEPSRESETPPPPAEAAKPSDITAVMKVIAAVADSDIRGLATRALQFIRNRFPRAVGTPTDRGFSFVLDDEHVATVVIGKNFVEMEAGADRVSTGKIRDLERLELMLELPSVTKSFDGLKA
jgi:ribose 5-phosphate isomerase B